MYFYTINTPSTVASLILHHMVFSYAGTFCNEAYSKKGVFWHDMKQIWETTRDHLPWKALRWKNHWILPKKAKPHFLKLLFKLVKPLWKSKKCYRQASINPNINFRQFFVVMLIICITVSRKRWGGVTKTMGHFLQRQGGSRDPQDPPLDPPLLCVIEWNVL